MSSPLIPPKKIIDQFQEYYIKCSQCGQLHDLTSSHFDNCTVNYDVVNGIKTCWSCGKSDKIYSSSQLDKKHKARCSDCVSGGENKQYEPFAHLVKYCYRDINSEFPTPNHKLYDMVIQMNKNMVEQLLSDGANPNYTCQSTVSSLLDLNNPEENQWVSNFYNLRDFYLFDSAGNEIPNIDSKQPTTPLKMAIFKMSDCFFSDADYDILIEIVYMLISYGANKKEGFDYYLYRYGETSQYDSNHFNELFDLLKIEI